MMVSAMEGEKSWEVSMATGRSSLENMNSWQLVAANIAMLVLQIYFDNLGYGKQ